MVAGQTPHSEVPGATDLDLTSSSACLNAKPSHLSGHQMAMQRSHPSKVPSCWLTHSPNAGQGNPCQMPNRPSLPTQRCGDNWCLALLV